MSNEQNGLIHKLDKSAIATFIGIALLFSTSVFTTIYLPPLVDSSWTEPTSDYQVQMYENVDPSIYISTAGTGSNALITVQHMQDNGGVYSAFVENEVVRIVPEKGLEGYVTKQGDPVLKVTTDALLLRHTDQEGALQGSLQEKWVRDNPGWEKKGLVKPRFTIYELYRPANGEGFAVMDQDVLTANWVDTNFQVVGRGAQERGGVVYTKNPVEFRVRKYSFGHLEEWRYAPEGKPIENLDELLSSELGFMSREELINMGEDIFIADGCWYCHTDQTRTLVQDTVMNGSESYPAPPSSANEYVYQRVSFLGTRRIGPDISRVGIKRPSRDWHKAHFWSPKTESLGSIMPAFQYFFDDDPRGTSRNPYGVPNYRFEAIFQYLMTKGTRLAPPDEAWWEGKDKLRTIDIIEGRG